MSYQRGVTLDKARIGEILLVREVADPFLINQALREASPQRLVSLLIGRAQLDPDDGALALAEQSGYPAALQRHLERRDPAYEQAIPVELVRRWVVVPLGRSSRGHLVVVARDPTPILHASLEHATRERVSLAVTPFVHLERLIRAVYGELLVEEPAPPTPVPYQPAITDLDLSMRTPPSVKRVRTVSRMFDEDRLELPELRKPAPGLDAALLEIGNAITPAAAERLCVEHASRRWSAALLLGITDRIATARRGRGGRIGTGELAIVLPLDVPSTLQAAVDGGAPTSATGTSNVQEALGRLLGDASTCAAAPIVTAGSVRAVLAVGVPLHGGQRESLADLSRLADALALSLERLARP
jgi:hypothetical protein